MGLQLLAQLGETEYSVSLLLLVSVPDPKPTPAQITFIIACLLEVIYVPDEVWGQDYTSPSRPYAKPCITNLKQTVDRNLDTICVAILSGMNESHQWSVSTAKQSASSLHQ